MSVRLLRFLLLPGAVPTLARVLGLGLLLAAPTALAFDEFAYDLRLAKALAKAQMFDYAARHLEAMAKQYPNRGEEVLLEQARLAYLTGKKAQADQALAKIPASSALYSRSRLVLAEMAVGKGDAATAKQAFSQFFAKVTAPLSDSRDDQEEFRDAVLQYAQVLKQEGDGAGAAKVMGYLAAVKGEDGASDRQLVFLKSQAILAAEDQKTLDGKPVDKAAVAAAVTALEGLQWQGVDAVAAAGLVEVCHGYVLLGENDKALGAVAGADEIMAEVEGILKQQGNLGASPVAGALFYSGRALKGKALEAFNKKDKEQSKDLLSQALKRFYKVTKDYRSSNLHTPALAEFGKCRNLLEKEFGVTIKTRGGSDESGEFEVKMQQAGAFLGSKKYEDAAAGYLEAIRLARVNSRFPEAAVRLVVCYGKLERYLEAEALASYLAEAFRDADDTADALFKLGAVFYEKAKTETDAGRRDAFTARAVQVWDAFVDVKPTHESAPEIAFMVAEDAFRRAADVAKQATAEKDAAKKEALKKSARALYADAIPRYQRVVDRFGTHEKAVRALYKLGWIYYSTERPADAAETFLRYAESESSPKLNDDRLEAKFRAAEQLMLSGSPEEGVEHFRQLLDWLKPGEAHGFDVNTVRAKRLREDASSYLGWAYDLWAEASRPKLDELDRRSQEYRRVTKEAEAAIAELGRQQQQVEAQVKAVDQEFADVEKGLVGGALDPELVKAQAQARGEGLDGMSEQEKEVMRRNASDKVKQILSGVASRERDQLSGEKLEYEQQREAVKAGKTQAAERQTRVGASLATATAKLAELQQTRGKQDGERQTLETEATAAQTAVDQAQKELDEAERSMAAAVEQQQSGDAAVREQAQKTRVAAATAKQAAAGRLEAAQEALNKAQTAPRVARLNDLRVALAASAAEAETLTSAVRRLENERKQADCEAEALQATLLALAKVLEKNELQRRVLDATPEQKEAAQKDVKALGDEAVVLFRAAHGKRLAALTQAQEAAKAEIEAAKGRIEAAKARLAQVEQEQAPVRAAFEKAKRAAQEQFLAFLGTPEYAQSKHVPDNMARLGTTFIEFRQFDKAAEYLDRLATQFPTAEAGKRALFSLGRAQYETGQRDKAAQSFAKLLDQAAEQPSGNLLFVSENLLQAGFPKESLRATEELLKRSEDKSRPDYESLRAGVREAALFRAGEAQLAMGNAGEALARYEGLLTERPNTAFYFDAKFHSASARRQKNPPDVEGAVRDYSDVLQFATDPVLVNRALCECGDLYSSQGDEGKARLGLARYQQVVMLADPGLAGNGPFVEKALFESARCYAKIGDSAQRDKMIARYKELFPSGQYRDRIDNPGAAAPPGK